jgi:hypothetical protein
VCTPVLTPFPLQKLRACLAATLLAAACPTAVLAQTPCERAAKDLSAKTKPASDAAEAVGKMRVGAAACTEAKRVKALLATLAKQADEASALCAGHDPKSLTVTILKFDVASVGVTATVLESDVEKLCR